MTETTVTEITVTETIVPEAAETAAENGESAVTATAEPDGEAEAPRLAPAPPTWLDEIASALAVRSQFVVSGNVRDIYPVPEGDETRFVAFPSAIWRVLQAKGVLALMVHDPVSGLRLHEDCDPRLGQVLTECGLPIGHVADTVEAMSDLVDRVTRERRLPVALIVDYASTQLRSDPAAADRLFVAMDKATRGPKLARPKLEWDCPAANPILWIVERAGDLPEWFMRRNPAVRDLMIELPDLSDRIAFASAEVERLEIPAEMTAEDRRSHVERLALGLDGMGLCDLRAVVDLAEGDGCSLREIDRAIRRFRIGTTRNPWTSQAMRARVRSTLTLLENRVKGQPRAIKRTYDILVRSIMGLSAAQTSSRGNRPRGVLFFVGPTGVGKTELAKGVTEALFGDESAMQRFDMSEFVNEASMGRLIGPPPGAPGYEQGGDLINAVRAKPFSVFLFDEIEKAHPRILDAFLQILDDGRLTDSRGETGYFSESLIIFTSNVGIVGGDSFHNSGQKVTPSDRGEQLEDKLTDAVADHFRFQLKRPELFNRMGQNIVVFEFINPKNAFVIFEALLRKVIRAVMEEHGISVTLTEAAQEELMALCTEEIGDGGRGIGNRIEKYLINPISRLLFDREDLTTVTITSVRVENREAVFEIAEDAAALEEGQKTAAE
ncbi:AAA family ATPase [Paralimibaculum aggregatum]|uniref:AAA family ATPase n=1 Tax=Paralimibaculum aggregatum TaxID=3036245 RepID=A0ABQ6LGL4_9RHOB|nr:AAA family ATPase [Limibaculum sp. NKW23]GMG82442.1 AAA family ATPase [Limibaculum sp. NKW23]